MNVDQLLHQNSPVNRMRIENWLENNPRHPEAPIIDRLLARDRFPPVLTNRIALEKQKKWRTRAGPILSTFAAVDESFLHDPFSVDFLLSAFRVLRDIHVCQDVIQWKKPWLYIRYEGEWQKVYDLIDRFDLKNHRPCYMGRIRGLTHDLQDWSSWPFLYVTQEHHNTIALHEESSHLTLSYINGEGEVRTMGLNWYHKINSIRNYNPEKAYLSIVEEHNKERKLIGRRTVTTEEGNRLIYEVENCPRIVYADHYKRNCHTFIYQVLQQAGLADDLYIEHKSMFSVVHQRDYPSSLPFDWMLLPYSAMVHIYFDKRDHPFQIRHVIPIVRAKRKLCS